MAAVEPYKYWAFISYSHQDKRWGDWLHKKLETYRVPHRLVGREHWSGTIPRRIFPIFRDRDELPSSADLGAVINEALRQSRYQIVICSPRAAASRWVNEEIKHFKSLGRENRLLALIVDGVPGASDGNTQSTDECFPSMLRYKLAADGRLTDEIAHPVAADAREGRDGRDAALLKVIAGLLGLSYDDLRQRERRRQFWRRVQIAGAAAFTLVLAFAGTQWFLNREAAQALEARIEKFYDLGRRELLDHHEARAAVYLNEAYKLGRDTPALRFMLGQAMQAIDPLEDIQINTGGPVRRPAFSPDSKSFITPTETETGVVAQIWETATGKQLALLKDLPNAPLVTKFFPDGKRVLVSGFQKEDLEETRGTGAFTGIWDSTTGKQLMRFDGHTGRFGQPTDTQARWLVTADAVGARGARIWNVSAAKPLHTLNSSTATLAASLSPDGRHVITGDESGQARLWDTQSGRLAFLLPGRLTSHVIGTLFTADSKRGLAFGARGDVRVWDIASGELLLAYAADSAGFNDIVLASDGRQLVTIGTEGYKVWDLERGILLFSRGNNLTNWSSAALNTDGTLLITADVKQSSSELLHLPSRTNMLTIERSGPIDAATFSPDGQRLLLASGASRAELWRLPIRLRQQFRHQRQNGKFASLYAARFDRSEQHVLTASYDGSLRLWDANSGLLVRRLDEGSPLVDAAYSPDGRRLVSLSVDGGLRLREATTLASIASIKLDPAWAGNPLVFGSDSQQFAILPDDHLPVSKTIGLRSVENGATVATLPIDCMPSALAFTLDSARLVSGCRDGQIQVWNIQAGTRDRTFSEFNGRVWKFASSGNDRLLAAVSWGVPVIQLWRVMDGWAPESVALPPPEIPEAVALDGAGQLLAAASNTGKVLVLNLEIDEWRALGEHTKEVQGLRFLRNGLLLSYRSDNAVKLWDPLRGELLGDVALHDWFVWSAEADHTGTRLLTGGLDGVAAIWDLPGELRNPEQIRERLRCRSPWELIGEALAPASASPDRCL